jgi:hypothetical protein
MATPRNIYEPGYFDTFPPVDPTTDRQEQIRQLLNLIHGKYSPCEPMHNEPTREWATKRLAALLEEAA